MIYVVLDQMAVNKDLTAIPEAGDVFISILRHRDAKRAKIRRGCSIGTRKKVVK
jgi:hypothetical protein